MTSADIVARLEQQFGPKIKAKKLDIADPFVAVDATDLVEVCRFLRDDPELRFDLLNCISGVDYFEPDPKKAPKAGFEPHLEVVYHLHSFTHRHRFVLKVSMPRWKDNRQGDLPELPSVSGIWAAAEWHEREVYDLCGVWFTDHPDLRRILLSEDWVGYPLRKDYEYPLEYHGIRGGKGERDDQERKNSAHGAKLGRGRDDRRGYLSPGRDARRGNWPGPSKPR